MVDVVAADMYEPAGSSMDGTWEGLRALFEGKKLIALAETGGMPVPDKVRAFETKWSWFSNWDITAYNITEEEVKAVYSDASFVTLDQVPDWRA
jgi:mannan endo-1,4-beta-mannosidase